VSLTLIGSGAGLGGGERETIVARKME
jgi:hypothetical protein